jgi:DNA repair ATPase RecN
MEETAHCTDVQPVVMERLNAIRDRLTQIEVSISAIEKVGEDHKVLVSKVDNLKERIIQTEFNIQQLRIIRDEIRSLDTRLQKELQTSLEASNIDRYDLHNRMEILTLLMQQNATSLEAIRTSQKFYFRWITGAGITALMSLAVVGIRELIVFYASH